ncbi:MAG TPA: ROK family transcriptional regulator [Pseudonocardiaceae bacterium]|jgi:predicted NBD/HSP70 family sugar kinase|nr:ROK family transcriptional regulator [Pseudonocardiaceae bacterium]
MAANDPVEATEARRDVTSELPAALGFAPLGQSALPSMNLVRELTDQIVLDAVFTNAPITRAELAQHTGLSKTTVSEAVRRLESVGLLRVAGAQRGRPGRVGTYYRVAAEAGFVLAVELNQAGIRVRTADLLGKSIQEAAHPPARPREPAEVATQLRAVVAEAIAAGTADHGRLLAVGISVAKPVDPLTKRVIDLLDTPYPEGQIQPSEILADLVDAPLLVDNDVNLAAIAERWHGAARAVTSFAYIYLGAGMGLGLVIDDKLIRGARGAAGEIGYLSVASTTAGPGRHAFARAVAAGGFGPADPAGAVPQDTVTVARQVLDRAAAGDAEAAAIVHREGRTIGEAIAAVCAVVDPELVLLGGPIGLHPQLLAPVRAAVRELAPLPPPVEAGALGEGAALQGALVLALQRGRADLGRFAAN